ncbi:hypothetical protein CFB46_22890 [Burkholderia sp. HI2761]|nr:hypothetical protein [Burkholderia sp. BE24]OXJ23714.1 hypothetical protein CFB46_22890 [Burkholderia sp. HI2761]
MHDSTPDQLPDCVLLRAQRNARSPDDRLLLDAAHPTGRAERFAHGRRYVQVMNDAYDRA